MSGTRRSLASLYTLLADNTAGDISAQDVRDLAASTFPVVLPLPQGRLTTESGVAVSTSDRTSQSTLYYTPYTGNGIWLYDGTIWQPYSFTERSLSLTGLTSGKNYDVFLYDNAGTLTLELSAAWTTDTARADALTTQDGILVKSGSTTRRWLGTIRTTGTTTTEDSATKRFVWNAYSRERRRVAVIETTASWTYGTATWRSMNNSTANRIEVVNGATGGVIQLIVSVQMEAATGFKGHGGIAINATNTNDADLRGRYTSSASSSNLQAPCSSMLTHAPQLGYTFYQATEYSETGTITYYSNDASRRFTSGMTGEWES